MSAEQSAPATTTVTSTTYPNSSLYVGDLRSDVGESDIYDAFKECGNILSVRVCRDVKDQRSLGYAYVNYQNPDHAQKALDTLNGKPLKGKPCRIMWSCRDPSQRKNNEGNIFVKNLEKTVTLVQLQDVFSHFGTISSCKVQTKDDGTSLCYGFVQFGKVEDSLKALEATKNFPDQFKSLGEKFTAEKFIPKHLRANNANETYKNVYVKNIGKKFTTEDLEKLFGEFGAITSAIIMTNENGESRCFGFVCFAEHDDAVKAKDALDGKAFKWKDEALVGPVAEGEDEEQLKKDGIVVKNLYCNRAQKKRERENTIRNERNLFGNTSSAKTDVYVRNLADSVTDEDLRNLFKEHGEVKSCVVMRYPNGTSRGFGFCDFGTSESALQAIQKIMGHLFHGKPLYLALAQKKSERHEILQSQHSQMRFFPQPMGSMYHPNMFPPNMFYNMPPGMYASYNQRNMYGRQPAYGRPYPQQPRHNMNRRGQQKQQVTMAPQPAAAAPQPQPAAVTPDNEKQRIGETIYSRIMPMFPNDSALWGKLTGMLLESIALEELRSLVADEAALSLKINQAKDYYDQHMKENVAK